MNTLIKAEERGSVNFGWLDSKHSFSFGHWYNPNRIQFGTLRVLNDDIIKGGTGFGTHPHQNMEIISIPLYGGLEHKDSMDTVQSLLPGEVQVMSAGTGITHSEYNHFKDMDTNFLQIWILPRNSGDTPRYDQREIQLQEGHFTTLVSPDNKVENDSLWIRQDSWISRLQSREMRSFHYKRKGANTGLFFFVIEGLIEIDTENDEILSLEKRDALEYSDHHDPTINNKDGILDLLVIEVSLD